MYTLEWFVYIDISDTETQVILVLSYKRVELIWEDVTTSGDFQNYHNFSWGNVSSYRAPQNFGVYNALYFKAY